MGDEHGAALSALTGAKSAPDRRACVQAGIDTCCCCRWRAWNHRARHARRFQLRLCRPGAGAHRRSHGRARRRFGAIRRAAKSTARRPPTAPAAAPASPATPARKRLPLRKKAATTARQESGPHAAPYLNPGSNTRIPLVKISTATAASKSPISGSRCSPVLPSHRLTGVAAQRHPTWRDQQAAR